MDAAESMERLGRERERHPGEPVTLGDGPDSWNGDPDCRSSVPPRLQSSVPPEARISSSVLLRLHQDGRADASTTLATRRTRSVNRFRDSATLSLFRRISLRAPASSA